MNAVSTKTDLVPAINEEEAVRVLQNSLYPGARTESIKLVLAWCRATGRDPMKKPIHIVPMKVKDQQTGRWEWRDVLMPGIGTYRSDAANTGHYAGKDEPEFGPDKRSDVDGCELIYPVWCKVTVKRLVGGQICSWTAKELWIENYASGQEGKGVNAMWRKRPYGQLAKVAEAQALRMAFPDECGNTNTTEEMEGKSFEGQTIDAEPSPAARAGPKTIRSERYEEKLEAENDPSVSLFFEQADAALISAKDGTKALKLLMLYLDTAPTMDDVGQLHGHPFVKHAMANWTPMLKQQIDEAFKAAADRLEPKWEKNGNGKTNHISDAAADSLAAGMDKMTAALKAQNDRDEPVSDDDGKRMAEELKRLHDGLKAEKSDDTGEKEWEPGDP